MELTSVTPESIPVKEKQKIEQVEQSNEKQPVTSSPRRRAAPVSTTSKGRGFRFSTLIAVVLALIVGLGAGALIMRHRYRSQDVVVSVNGAIIDKNSFYHRLEGAAGAQVLRQMVGEQLQLDFAKQQGVAPTDADVDAKYAEANADPIVAKALKSSGKSPDEIKRAIRIQLAKSNVVTKGITVTDAEVQKYYDANIDKRNSGASYYTPEKTTIQVIVTTTQAEASKAQDDLRKGIPFGTVAKTYSRDKSKANGGILPTIQRGRSNVSRLAAMENAIFAMKIGDQIGPREFVKAWWIIKCLEKQPESTQPFDKVKTECRTGALMMKGLPLNGKKVQDDFAAYQKDAKVQAFWRQYESAVSPK